MNIAQENRSLVKVIHGANEGVFDLAGHTVVVVRASLEVPFNIPPDAAAFVNGEMVDERFVLVPDDTLEFVKQEGQKGLGDLLTPEDLMARWRISTEQYQELRHRGLPVFTFPDGMARHPEVTVDEWWKAFGGHAEGAVPQHSASETWAHPAGSEPPPSYPFGPVEGTQEQLGSWIHPHGKGYGRHLQGRAKDGSVWVRKIHERHYEMWFKSQRALEAATKKRLKSPGPT